MRNIDLHVHKRKPENPNHPDDGLSLIAYSYYRHGLIRLAMERKRNDRGKRTA
ncbi:MAG: hypothetical protein ACLFOY_18975 [Desulfatibacillaceae bacterium]